MRYTTLDGVIGQVAVEVSYKQVRLSVGGRDLIWDVDTGKLLASGVRLDKVRGCYMSCAGCGAAGRAPACVCHTLARVSESCVHFVRNGRPPDTCPIEVGRCGDVPCKLTM